LFVLGTFLATLPPAAGPPPPNPNGYDDFLAGGGLVAGNFDDVAEMQAPALSLLIASNAPALARFREGLARRTAVPVEAEITNLATMTTTLPALKRMANLLAAEGRLRELEQRPGEAARCYAEATRLGVGISDGVIIDRLVGIACEAIGETRLMRLVPSLNASQIRSLLPTLNAAETNEVTWDAVLRHEQRFARAQVGRYSNPIMLVAGWWMARASVRRASEKHDLAVARLRLLITELALRERRLEGKPPPASLEAMVPATLSRLPRDPFGNGPLVYRPQGTNWLLYSLGPDRVDNGGQPIQGRASRVALPAGTGGTAPPAQGDLFYDSAW